VDPLKYVPLLMAVIGTPAALISWLLYRAKRTAPKDQSYYETLISRSWQSEDRIREELEQERGRKQQLEAELEKERARAGDLVKGLQADLDKCKARCVLLQHQLTQAQESEKNVREENRSLRSALRKWQQGGANA
jgi:septal ring factor EnvC (AmiA/AmiB activator)